LGSEAISVSRHEGGCLCRGIRFEISGEIGPIGHCHDSICRKAHSAAFASHAAIPTDRFRWTRGENLIKRYESSPGGFRWFCGVCGSHLTGIMSDRPGAVIVVSIGSLDDDPQSRPVAHENVGSKAPWFEIADDLPQFEGGFPKNPGET
jgi:hypothetical protein